MCRVRVRQQSNVLNVDPGSPVNLLARRSLPHLQPEALLHAFVDRAPPGCPSSDARFMRGSSMGGLISADASCEHPQVFGAATALSAHWIGSFERNTPIPDAALALLLGV